MVVHPGIALRADDTALRTGLRRVAEILERFMAKQQTAQRKRISLFAPGSSDPASVWATVNLGENGGDVYLLYDYPDLAPAAGWLLECDGRRYEVRSVNARRIQCVAVQL